jgi:hypothetical protein
MKILNVILFKDGENNETVCEKLSRSHLLPHQEFCGIWGIIQFNNAACLTAVSSSVNYFLKSEDKTEIYFGCSEKDYKDIISLIDTNNCVVNILSCSDFER